MCGTYRCVKFNLECPGLKGFDAGDVVAQVPWGACRVFALGLVRRRFVGNFQHIKHYCLRKCNEAHRIREVLTCRPNFWA
jgi:hypothetical protein